MASKFYVWAHENIPTNYPIIYAKLLEYDNRQHWSRVFEYPWILTNGDFCSGEIVLDAGGGDNALQCVLADFGCYVTNVDLDEHKNLHKSGNLVFVHGDLRELPFEENHFDKIVCVSVLEHIEDPLSVVKELWRVLRKGGKLLISMDVASYLRWNHTIDFTVAKRIVDFFGMSLETPSQNALRAEFNEIQRNTEHEPDKVSLNVLCLFAEK